MSIFYNIRAQFVEDEPYLIDLISRHRPSWALVMDGKGLALKLKAASPNTNVIHRTWPDDGLQYVGSPTDWLNKKTNEIGGTGLWAYTVNEIGLQPDWHIELIKLCAARGWPINLVIGNPSVGTPQPEEWSSPKVLELLRLLDLYRDHVVLGLHEYAHGVITSGFQDKNFETNRTLWPAKVDRAKNNYHVGRFKFCVDAAITAGIKPPRIVITEHGFDSLGDMNGKLPGGGWRTLQAYWNGLWGATDPQEAYSYQLCYAADVAYTYGGVVEGQLIFQYGGKESGLWNAFDVEKARTLHQLLINHDKGSIPPPVENIREVTIEAVDPTTPVRFRSMPVLDNANIVGYIKERVAAKLYDTPPVGLSGYTFKKFQVGNVVGWLAVELLNIRDPQIDPETITMPKSVFGDIKARVANTRLAVQDLNRQLDELSNTIEHIS